MTEQKTAERKTSLKIPLMKKYKSDENETIQINEDVVMEFISSDDPNEGIISQLQLENVQIKESWNREVFELREQISSMEIVLSRKTRDIQLLSQELNSKEKLPHAAPERNTASSFVNTESTVHSTLEENEKKQEMLETANQNLQFQLQDYQSKIEELMYQQIELENLRAENQQLRQLITDPPVVEYQIIKKTPVWKKWLKQIRNNLPIVLPLLLLFILLVPYMLHWSLPMKQAALRPMNKRYEIVCPIWNMRMCPLCPECDTLNEDIKNLLVEIENKQNQLALHAMRSIEFFTVNQQMEQEIEKTKLRSEEEEKKVYEEQQILSTVRVAIEMEKRDLESIRKEINIKKQQFAALQERVEAMLFVYQDRTRFIEAAEKTLSNIRELLSSESQILNSRKEEVRNENVILEEKNREVHLIENLCDQKERELRGLEEAISSKTDSLRVILKEAKDIEESVRVLTTPDDRDHFTYN